MRWRIEPNDSIMVTWPYHPQLLTRQLSNHRKASQTSAVLHHQHNIRGACMMSTSCVNRMNARQQKIYIYFVKANFLTIETTYTATNVHAPTGIFCVYLHPKEKCYSVRVYVRSFHNLCTCIELEEVGKAYNNQ